MDLFQFSADAAASPPSAPTSPDSGYPTVGNPATGTPATLLGDYWFYQVGAELHAVLADAAASPAHGTLTQLRDALRAMGLVRPVEALPYPTICTASNALTVTPASATAGGRVSVAAGTWVELCEEIVAGQTGRIRSDQTPAYQSADLAVSSTYYLRARMVDGALSLYVQKGTDSDAGWSQSWTGTPDGASGGGVDSSKLDMLIARVVTGVAGSTPTVTALANSARLHNSATVEMLDCGTGSSNYAIPGWFDLAARTLNWARKPASAFVVLGGFSDNSDGWTASGTAGVDAAAVKVTSATRYSLSGQFAIWEDIPSNVSLRVQWFAEA